MCAKSWKSMIKCAINWESTRKCTKSWKNIRKGEKVKNKNEIKDENVWDIVSKAEKSLPKTKKVC